EHVGTGERSDLADVRRLLAFRTRHQVELHALALCERAEAARPDGGEVDEHVLAGVRRDEAEALGVVEPLDRALHATLGRPRRARGPRRASTATAAPAPVAAAA